MIFLTLIIIQLKEVKQSGQAVKPKSKNVKLSMFSNLFFRDKNSTSNMKIDTLAFLNCLLSNHSPVVFHSHIKIIIPVSNEPRHEKTP